MELLPNRERPCRPEGGTSQAPRLHERIIRTVRGCPPFLAVIHRFLPVNCYLNLLPINKDTKYWNILTRRNVYCILNIVLGKCNRNLTTIKVESGFPS